MAKKACIRRNRQKKSFLGLHLARGWENKASLLQISKSTKNSFSLALLLVISCLPYLRPQIITLGFKWHYLHTPYPFLGPFSTLFFYERECPQTLIKATSMEERGIMSHRPCWNITIRNFSVNYVKLWTDTFVSHTGGVIANSLLCWAEPLMHLLREGMDFNNTNNWCGCANNGDGWAG